MCAALGRCRQNIVATIKNILLFLIGLLLSQGSEILHRVLSIHSSTSGLVGKWLYDHFF